MQLKIEQVELEQAVRNYIVTMGIDRSIGDIDFTATRGENAGVITTIEFAPVDAEKAGVANLSKPAQSVQHREVESSEDGQTEPGLNAEEEGEEEETPAISPRLFG
jgi:hypothetical protein